MAVACVPLWMVLRHFRLRCEQRHAERMKALEMGSPLSTLDPPKDQMRYMRNAFWVALWMGAACPMAAVWAAAWATGGEERLGRLLAVWIIVGAVSMAGVICATVVLAQSRPWRMGKVRRAAAPTNGSAVGDEGGVG